MVGSAGDNKVQGTRLGLSIIYDIVMKGRGGSIAFDSEVDEFTKFVVTLPCNMVGE